MNVILGIETSCDETCAAVIRGHEVLSNVVSSQAALHEQWGGVVPEVASRAHVESILPVIQQALILAGVGMDSVEGVAVTNRPGLAGALSVGVTAAKALAWSRQVPLLGVHHLEGHIASVRAGRDEPVPLPHAVLIVSGGHTEIVRVDQEGYTLLAETLDDAAGEAFDKGARVLGLGYPGGLAVQQSAAQGDPGRYSFPIGVADVPRHFSFSGLKTAVLRLAEKEGRQLHVPSAALALQTAVVGALTQKALHALRSHDLRALALVGGVAANLALRESLREACRKDSIEFYTPEPSLCTDNAAMIALAGLPRLGAGERDDGSLEVFPNAPLPAALS